MAELNSLTGTIKKEIEGVVKMKMSPEEIISYCHYGMLESVTAEQLLQVVKFYEDAETSCNESHYDIGWEDGYLHANAEMEGKLTTMWGDGR